MKALIIGSGIAGIACSIRLAVRGMDVHVFETNSYPGGKLTEIHHAGFRFDAGPSLFTMPAYVDELFELAGKNPRDYFKYKKLDIICRYFYENGTVISAFADKKEYAREIKDKLGVSEKLIFNYLAYCEDIFKYTEPVFLKKSLHRLKSYFSKETVIGLLNAHKLSIFSSMDAVNRKKLKNPQLVQLFNRYATYNGSNPYQAPGVLNVIPHLEHNLGAFFPEGGMHEITRSLYKLACELGVSFHFSQKVDRIVVEKKVAKGAKVNDAFVPSDLVISNMDIIPTYQKLLQGLPKPKHILRQERSSSALIFYWGIEGIFDELSLHNIFFSKAYKEEFAHIFERQTVYEDPTVYINISAKENKADAPANTENWFVMINVPCDKGQKWDDIISIARENIIKKISRILQKNIAPLIKTENILDPRGIAMNTSSYAGSLYGTSSNHRLAAFLRHANFSRKIKGLYFCGGSVHPGGGIPLCLLSASIVSDMIKIKH